MLRRLLVPLPALLALVAVPAVALGKPDKAPNVSPARVIALSPTGATVTAKVNTRGEAAGFALEFGTTDAFGARTADVPLPADNGNQDVTAALTDLQPGTSYVVRVVATNVNGSDAGPAAAFTTAPAPAAGAPPAAPAPADDGKGHGSDDGKGRAKGKDKQADAPRGGPTVPAPDLTSGPAATPADAVLGKDVVVGAARGTITVKVRGADGYSELGAGAAVPVGSIVDATRGTVRLTTAVDGSGTQAALVRGAKFEVRQARSGRGMTDLVLRGGDFAACRRHGDVAAHAARRKHKRAPRRSLWAKDDSGRFRTHGRHSVATVRGTEWRTTDTCRGTTTSVRKGAVLVRDLRSGRRVLVRAGERHLARARARGLS
jgi:hypothetical protein